MARQFRLEYPGALYGFTAHDNEQQATFHSDSYRPYFRALSGLEILPQRWRCNTYCFIGNHNHLLFEMPDHNLSRDILQFHGCYTQHVNLQPQRIGHLLQRQVKTLLPDRSCAFEQYRPFDRDCSSSKQAAHRLTDLVHQVSAYTHHSRWNEHRTALPALIRLSPQPVPTHV